MKKMILATVVTVGIGLMAASPVLAAPASGNVIAQAATSASPITKAVCGMRRVCGVRGCVTQRACW